MIDNYVKKNETRIFFFTAIFFDRAEVLVAASLASHTCTLGSNAAFTEAGIEAKMADDYDSSSEIINANIFRQSGLVCLFLSST